MAPVRRSLTLGRKQRLKQGRDFARIKAKGKRIVKGCLIANWMALPAGSSSRLGVVTSRRTGNAVARARARRLLRESFRLHQTDLLQAVDMVLIARPNIVGKRFVEVEKDFLTTMHLAGLLRGN